ncbi:hypothetical protein GPECTOR_70g465 [Gonium pectorale]|uniref:Uncharacterized protein n=1 Tax=Gonium pectorale TaxID=33097 RepID=A0A150G3Z2_GONPE|nr:hypothetical protein GPECTOR_70g465 [Gonium pectorale]|eukprot:KXZ44235.1 hypothetical protein GPECTOR_70g465 [Gonium pectorale]
MPETELEKAAQRVRQLEQEALDMHELAQRLNKEGRFQEAQAAYSAMHRLEDEASALAAKVGCVACVLGEPGQSSDDQPSLCNLDPATLLPYRSLHPARKWPPRDAPLLARRSVGAVEGSALADAAAMGVHWVYDLETLRRLEVERRAASATSPSTDCPASTAASEGSGSGSSHPYDFGLEFMDPPRSPFYAYPSGRNSPYGEQTLVLLRSLAECRGLEAEHYAELFAGMFGPGFEGYRDVSTKGFLRNYGRAMPPPLSGANDAQANCIARLAPLVAAFGSPSTADPSRGATASGSFSGPALARSASSAGEREGAGTEAQTSDLLCCVELATRVTQNTDAAVAWACVGAAVLELIVLGATAEAAVREVIRDLESPEGRLAPYCRGPNADELAAQLRGCLALRSSPVAEAVAALGRNCHMPNALTTPLQVVLHVEHLAASLRMGGDEAAGAAGSTSTDSGGASSMQLPADVYKWGVRLADQSSTIDPAAPIVPDEWHRC